MGLCPKLAGLPESLVVGRILPGIAVSLVAGNLFYAWQARRLSQRTGKPVTALPFGVNTVSLFAFIFLILGPVYRETHDADLAWKVSLVAGFLGGVVEIATSFFGAWIRRHTPRAALLSALAGVGITFIAMGFIFQIFSSPLVALFPALLVLIGYAGRVRWPLGLPTGFIAVVVGTLTAWLLRGLAICRPMPEWPAVASHLLFSRCRSSVKFSRCSIDPRVWKYAAVFIPMAVLNVIGSMQNLESAEAAGDKFDTRSSLLANGISAVVGVFFGNPFAPTIYIGHPGWKAMGARSGYSVLNAVAITLICLTGAMPFVLWFMPLEVDARHPALDRPDHHRAGVSGSAESARAGGGHRLHSLHGRVGRAADPDGARKSRAGLFVPAGRGQFQPGTFLHRDAEPGAGLHADLDFLQRHHGEGHRPAMARRGDLVPDRGDRSACGNHPRICLHPGWRIRPGAFVFPVDRNRRRDIPQATISPLSMRGQRCFFSRCTSGNRAR